MNVNRYLAIFLGLFAIYGINGNSDWLGLGEMWLNLFLQTLLLAFIAFDLRSIRISLEKD